jgi:hypothetical protein
VVGPMRPILDRMRLERLAHRFPDGPVLVVPGGHRGLGVRYPTCEAYERAEQDSRGSLHVR